MYKSKSIFSLVPLSLIAAVGCAKPAPPAPAAPPPKPPTPLVEAPTVSDENAAERRQDRREIAEDKQEIRDDKADLKQINDIVALNKLKINSELINQLHLVFSTKLVVKSERFVINDFPVTVLFRRY